jgi:hypothetical protein
MIPQNMLEQTVETIMKEREESFTQLISRLQNSERIIQNFTEKTGALLNEHIRLETELNRLTVQHDNIVDILQRMTEDYPEAILAIKNCLEIRLQSNDIPFFSPDRKKQVHAARRESLGGGSTAAGILFHDLDLNVSVDSVNGDFVKLIAELETLLGISNSSADVTTSSTAVIRYSSASHESYPVEDVMVRLRVVYEAVTQHMQRYERLNIRMNRYENQTRSLEQQSSELTLSLQQTQKDLAEQQEINQALLSEHRDLQEVHEQQSQICNRQMREIQQSHEQLEGIQTTLAQLRLGYNSLIRERDELIQHVSELTAKITVLRQPKMLQDVECQTGIDTAEAMTFPASAMITPPRERRIRPDCRTAKGATLSSSSSSELESIPLPNSRPLSFVNLQDDLLSSADEHKESMNLQDQIQALQNAMQSLEAQLVREKMEFENQRTELVQRQLAHRQRSKQELNKIQEDNKVLQQLLKAKEQQIAAEGRKYQDALANLTRIEAERDRAMAACVKEKTNKQEAVENLKRSETMCRNFKEQITKKNTLISDVRTQLATEKQEKQQERAASQQLNVQYQSLSQALAKQRLDSEQLLEDKERQIQAANTHNQQLVQHRANSEQAAERAQKDVVRLADEQRHATELLTQQATEHQQRLRAVEQNSRDAITAERQLLSHEQARARETEDRLRQAAEALRSEKEAAEQQRLEAELRRTEMERALETQRQQQLELQTAHEAATRQLADEQTRLAQERETLRQQSEEALQIANKTAAEQQRLKEEQTRLAQDQRVAKELVEQQNVALQLQVNGIQVQVDTAVYDAEARVRQTELQPLSVEFAVLQLERNQLNEQKQALQVQVDAIPNLAQERDNERLITQRQASDLLALQAELEAQGLRAAQHIADQQRLQLLVLQAENEAAQRVDAENRLRQAVDHQKAIEQQRQDAALLAAQRTEELETLRKDSDEQLRIMQQQLLEAQERVTARVRNQPIFAAAALAAQKRQIERQAVLTQQQLEEQARLAQEAARNAELLAAQQLEQQRLALEAQINAMRQQLEALAQQQNHLVLLPPPQNEVMGLNAGAPPEQLVAVLPVNNPNQPVPVANPPILIQAQNPVPVAAVVVPVQVPPVVQRRGSLHDCIKNW